MRTTILAAATIMAGLGFLGTVPANAQPVQCPAGTVYYAAHYGKWSMYQPGRCVTSWKTNHLDH